MVDIVEEQDTELDDLLDMNGPFMSNQEYYKYNKSKYEASQGGQRNSEASIHIADVNTTYVDLTHHNDPSTHLDSSRKITAKDFQSKLYEKKVEEVFKRSLSDSVDNEEVLSVEILESKNEALNFQKILNDNQMFLKDIKSMHNGQNARLTQQSNPCDSRHVAPPYTNGQCPDMSGEEREACDCPVADTTTRYPLNTETHIRPAANVNSSPGIYDYACNCKVPHTELSDTFEQVNSCIPDVIQHDNGPMSSQCILENYQNMYNDIRLGQVTSGFSQCDGWSCSGNEYYRYGNQTEYYSPDGKCCSRGLPEEMVHLELQKRLGNEMKTPSG